MYRYSAKILRVVDGDTLWLDVDLGFRAHMTIDVRLARINAPEMVNWGAEGIVDTAAAFILARCPIGSVVVLDVTKAEKYGRWLGWIYYLAGETDMIKIVAAGQVLNDELLRSGLVEVYRG
jgi:micrococcal nuclease